MAMWRRNEDEEIEKGYGGDDEEGEENGDTEEE